MSQEFAVVSSQWEDGMGGGQGLLVPLQLVDGVRTTADILPALPLGAVYQL